MNKESNVKEQKKKGFKRILEFFIKNKFPIIVGVFITIIIELILKILF